MDATPAPRILTTDERRAILLQTIGYFTARGYQVTSQTDTTAQLVRSKRFSCLIASALFLCGFGVLFVLYLLIFLAARDSMMFLAVNEIGEVSYNGVVPRRRAPPSSVGMQVTEAKQAFLQSTAGARLNEAWQRGPMDRFGLALGMAAVAAVMLMLVALPVIALVR